ncbi:replication-associated recombination protein A [Mycoplasmopsis gallinarum]
MKNLANDLRPQTLNDIIGQKQAVNLLKQIAKNKLRTSFIFFGEAGTGKTSSAIALANDLKMKYGLFNATINSKNDLLNLIENNEILIIDEIHRLNKDKQDILLSYLEFDKIIVYATTTENPYFRVNPALRSRMQIIQFNKLSEVEIFDGLKNVIKNNYANMKISDEVLMALVRHSTGDYRSSLNDLQLLYLLKNDEEITFEDIKKLIPNINFYSDMNSSAHYNNLSAFHKSLRGSDVNAALYYGTIILKSGDYQGLFRRLLAHSYEDVGLADPNLALRVNNAFDVVEKLGFPEANLPVYYAIIASALAPKSNSVYKAMHKIIDFVDAGNIYEVPKHLRDSHYKSASKLGDGIGYKYPHDFPNSVVKQTYLPKEIKDKTFFTYSNNDLSKIKEYYDFLQKLNKE